MPDENWFSPHFWTHTQGYKMCLCVVANGEGPAGGKFTSILIHMMKGEFDNQLVWPFSGIITVELVDQQGGGEHWSKEIYITQSTLDEVANRLVDGERSEKSWEIFNYIPHDKLGPKYLKDDRLCF